MLEKDDLFSSGLAPASFDLTHARFQIAPLGRAEEQLTAYIRATKPGGLLVLEDPDTGSWHFNPRAAAAERLIELILEAFKAAGGNFNAGRELPALLRSRGLEPELRAEGLPRRRQAIPTCGYRFNSPGHWSHGCSRSSALTS